MRPFEEWLLKSEHDLKAAETLLKDDELLDMSIYHTQQCAEKALKGFLAYHEQEIEKTHHLKPVLDDCIAIDVQFSQLKDDAIFLTPFSTEFRYPYDCMMPDLEDTQCAVMIARKIFEFVKNKINDKEANLS